MSKFAISLPLCALSFSANAGHPQLTSYLEKTFASAFVMTDSEVMTLGVHNFDPNDWFNLSNENIGTEESLKLRQQLGLSTLPYTLQLSPDDHANKHEVFFRLSALASRKDVVIRQQDVADYQTEVVLGGYLAYRYRLAINDRLTLIPGLGTHLQYFRNNHDYRSDFAKENLQPILDDLVFNTDAWALSLNPHLIAEYKMQETWGHWKVTSAYNYVYGTGWGKANHGDVGHPEAWYVSNGVEAVYDIDEFGKSVQSLYTSLRRVDVGADVSDPLGTNYYYEASIGWLMSPPFESSWIENIGLGLNINYGSAFRGGSIVLYFNQD